MKKWSIAVLGVVLAMVALTGCQSPKAMAYVNGTQISAEQYEQTIAGLNDLGQPLSPEDRGGVATNLIQFEIVRQLGADQGITIPQTQQDAALADQVNQAAQAGVELKGGSLDYYRQYTEATLLIQAAGQQEAAKALQEATVELNPKYGAWSADEQGLMSAQSGKGSLSSTDAQPR
ncbi:MAG: SurA N-terminal domain-containing protein [Propionibacteriales bacterium]|nr:SurA N-terminal domain-containing protein [Propionibacteriales bacterium]